MVLYTSTTPLSPPDDCLTIPLQVSIPAPTNLNGYGQVSAGGANEIIKISAYDWVAVPEYRRASGYPKRIVILDKLTAGIPG